MNDLVRREDVKLLIKKILPMTPMRSDLIHEINMMEGYKLPDKQVIHCTDTNHHRWAKDGWNACLREIEKQMK